MCVWVCGKFDQPEILGKGLSEQVTIELRPKDPQKDYLFIYLFSERLFKAKKTAGANAWKGENISHYSPIYSDAYFKKKGLQKDGLNGDRIC